MVVTQTEPDKTTSELLIRAAQGDREAFGLLVAEYEERLLGQALALCGNPMTAEELAQQTWIEAWKSLRRFNHSCRFTTWLYAILLHSHYHLLRQQRSSPVPFASLVLEESSQKREELLAQPADAPDPGDALFQKERATEWREILESLPEFHREVILLRFFEDATLEEIAAIIGCPVGTVKTRLHHALIKLRKMKTRMNSFDPGRHT